MKRFVRWSAAAALLLPIAACGPRELPPVQTTPAAPAQALSQQDIAFMRQAAESGAAEVQFGQLAAQKGARPQVRQFGQMMADDHTRANQQLAQIAQSKGAALPESMDAEHAQMLAKLQRERGAAFDRDYMRGQIADHQAAVALFQQEASGGQDPDLKAFAAQTLPTLQHHLELARGLEGGRPVPPAPRRR